MRVLVVDDNEDAVLSLGKLLRLKQYEVHVAFSGQSAIDTALAFHPDVMILDIAMPSISGIDVAKQVLLMPDLRDVVLIALTGYGDAMNQARIAEVDFNHVLLKPCQFDQLSAILQDISGRRKSA
jgi:CheY-like chemotaxis protein